MNRAIVKQTPFGSICIVWAVFNGKAKIVRVLLSKPGMSAVDQGLALYPKSKAASCQEIDETASAMHRLLEGEAIEFSLEVAKLSLCTEFQRRVLRAEHGIPRGRVSTYRLIAEHLGKNGGARAVGNALANNPFPLIIPCHRAVRSDGHLGGYQGGIEMKRTLLEMEGISFDKVGRVAYTRFHYAQK